MTPEHKQRLRFLLENGPAPLRLSQDLVLVYAGQVPMTGAWVLEGRLEFSFDSARASIIEAKGAQLLEELHHERPFVYSLRLLRGSLCYFFNRSHLQKVTTLE